MADGPDPAIARVGRAVADRRLALGMATQRDLADKAGVALNTAAFLERGRTFPREGNQRKLEVALQWPPGTLRSMLHDASSPAHAATAAPPVDEPIVHARVGSAPSSGSARPATVHTLSIASAVAAIATKSIAILLRTAGADDPETGTTLRELDGRLLELETIIAASLPHASADAFDETMSALADVHRQREALKDAARQVG
ncbi:helix-turn-helix domain-containing protein [Mycolicibacterium wolinskyi]|uniref:helix-turn-helix domain-containing protein n=1 Tax=Mycolicibacterium wolinskyi TaxID=59750 RepID=UPI001042645B|nr:helix-turn-helix transcriptional regulator [Mycolicibacterium wolinskyi]